MASHPLGAYLQQVDSARRRRGRVDLHGRDEDRVHVFIVDARDVRGLVENRSADDLEAG